MWISSYEKSDTPSYPHDSSSREVCMECTRSQKRNDNFLWDPGLKGIWPWYIPYSDCRANDRHDLEINRATALPSLGSGGLIVQRLLLALTRAHRAWQNLAVYDTALSLIDPGEVWLIRPPPGATHCQSRVRSTVKLSKMWGSRTFSYFDTTYVKSWN